MQFFLRLTSNALSAALCRTASADPAALFLQVFFSILNKEENPFQKYFPDFFPVSASIGTPFANYKSISTKTCRPAERIL